MKARPRRSIVHVDLAPFFVAVERSLDPALRGKPVIVGAGSGRVAAASDEARAAGVVPGMPLSAALQRCPEAVVRPGDLDAYARVSEEVTSLLLGHSRRVERPSADEAYVDLTPEGPNSPNAVPAAESIKDELQRRLGLDASIGVGSSRIAARVASRLARPRGLLVLLPGYETSFLARQPLGQLASLPPSAEATLVANGIDTLGALVELGAARLHGLIGPLAQRVLDEASGDAEALIAVAAPPQAIQEDVQLRVRPTDVEDLGRVLDALAARAARRLRPFGLRAATLTVDLRRGVALERRSVALAVPLGDERSIAEVARQAAALLLEPVAGVRGLGLRLGRLAPAAAQASLFPPPTRLAR